MAPKKNRPSSFSLDILSEHPLFRTYIPLCFFYPLPSGPGDGLGEEIPEILNKGLQRLADNFPWICGHVVIGGTQERGSSLGKIVSLPHHPIPELVVRNLESSLPSFGNLVAADFPFSLIEEDVLCPRKTFIEDKSAELPVLVLQLNYIKGGIVLSFVVNHVVMNFTGMSFVLSLFDKACRGEEFTLEELSVGNADRATAVPLIEGEVDITPRLKLQIQQPTPSGRVAPVNPPPAGNPNWAYFSFSPSALSSLKATASAEIPSNGAPFISLDDAISALIWQSVTRARLHRLDPAEKVFLARAVDVRGYLGISENYPGMLQNETYTPMLPNDLVSTPLGAVASRLRQELDPESLAMDTRRLVTLMARNEDKTKFSLAASIDIDRDTIVSSWMKVDAYNFDFGMGIKPESVKRPRYASVPSLAFMMPKTLEGEMSLAICLRDDEMESLRQDETWCKYAKYVG